MGFLNKMKTVFGTSKVEEDQLDESYIENIINTVENIPFAVSSRNVFYGSPTELAGYDYFQSVTIGTLKLKTNQGAKLIITGDDFVLNLSSDMLELESERTNEPITYVTKIDFEISKEDITKIIKSRIKSIQLTSKKEDISFSIIEIDEEDFDIAEDREGEEA